jgi:putative ABC transport system permease protein
MDFLLQTLAAVRAHALRFGLTSLGIAWGAFMLTYSLTTTEGMDRHFRDQLETAGPRVVYVFPGTIIKNRVGERGARPVELEAEDVARLPDFSVIDDAAPNLLLWNQLVRADRRTKLLTVFGVAPVTREIRNFEVAEGRFISGTDLARAARVAFLGSEAATRLFGERPALGRTIHIEGHPFEVCGVAVEKGQQLVGFGGRDDRGVLVPYTTVQRWLGRDDHLNQLVFRPVTRQRSGEGIARVRESVGLHHDFEPSLDTGLSFVNVQDVAQILDRLFSSLDFFLLAAAGITLAVGAVSVTNIMLVVVGERTREIGLRKAVGAPHGAIFRAFLAETALVCIVSGVLGALLGIGLAVAIAHGTPPDQRVISPPRFDLPRIATLVAILVATGIAAGLLPAWRAARIPPAEALRSH